MLPHPSLELRNGAVFIADSHFSHKDPRAYKLLDFLAKNPPPQIFFVGDIFQLFIGAIPSSLRLHAPLLAKISELARQSEVFYLEGNHDFSLPSLENVQIFPRKRQPLVLEYEGKTILLAHGDLFISPFYERYIQTMTHPLVTFFLRLLDKITLGHLYTSIHKKVLQKSIFALKNPDEKSFINKRLDDYFSYAKNHNLAPEILHFIIEGHFHSTAQNSLYKALPSFYCQKKILQLIHGEFHIFYSSN
ncbi:metallophosphoesterase [Helicobacter mustelae]|uniref:Putative metallophosphoesterase n=1 Tax=Helicobacter mustelae (strain ATCC 43772 / CCUG 25715 / CIP 103759 / LMG 18044 / NCTC 12198 / R85-136P) TaxID=679897 RepID=D3UGL9_HELM1|nr:metallophosphoesterase [Helicobacter mustelae]CBG39640.1 Putative metallophosphoesterase [Helicobacter mustelae 12198]SQH71151.1 metallophosphoesterase [Helicobacter mustelae]